MSDLVAGSPSVNLREKLAKQIIQGDVNDAAMPPPFCDNPAEMLQLALEAAAEMIPPEADLQAARALGARTHQLAWVPPANGYLRQVTPRQWQWQVRNQINVQIHDHAFRQFNGDWRLAAVQVSEGWMTYSVPTEVGKDPVTLEPQIQYRKWMERHFVILYELIDLKAQKPVRYGQDSMPLDANLQDSMSPELVQLFALMNAKANDAQAEAMGEKEQRLEIENQALQERLNRLERMMEMQLLQGAPAPVVVQAPPAPAAVDARAELRNDILDDEPEGPKATVRRTTRATRKKSG